MIFMNLTAIYADQSEKVWLNLDHIVQMNRRPTSFTEVKMIDGRTLMIQETPDQIAAYVRFQANDLKILKKD